MEVHETKSRTICPKVEDTSLKQRIYSCGRCAAVVLLDFIVVCVVCGGGAVFGDGRGGGGGDKGDGCGIVVSYQSKKNTYTFFYFSIIFRRIAGKVTSS